jgi:hypothetical protein
MTPEQAAQLDACSHGVNELHTKVNMIVRLLNGNPDEDIPGVRPRLMLVERRMNDVPNDLMSRLNRLDEENRTLREEWTKIKERYNGAKWVLGILGVTNASTLFILARFLLSGS